MPSPPKLIADAMLGALARWLRALDLDVAYDPALDDAELVARAVAEGRTILTRDRRLIQRRLARDHLLIRSDASWAAACAAIRRWSRWRLHGRTPACPPGWRAPRKSSAPVLPAAASIGPARTCSGWRSGLNGWWGGRRRGPAAPSLHLPSPPLPASLLPSGVAPICQKNGALHTGQRPLIRQAAWSRSRGGPARGSSSPRTAAISPPCCVMESECWSALSWSRKLRSEPRRAGPFSP
jgi:hypothetical protein